MTDLKERNTDAMVGRWQQLGQQGSGDGLGISHCRFLPQLSHTHIILCYDLDNKYDLYIISRAKFKL
jgi:hypothetical protein